MSSKKEKKRKWKRATVIDERMNSLRLAARWWAINITKPAFLKKQQRLDKAKIEKILKKRGFPIPKNQDYWNYIKYHNVVIRR